MSIAVVEKKLSYTNIIVLRGIASALVVYDHLFAQGGKKILGKEIFPVVIIREYLTYPAGIIQDFGWFGVALFFLISGFLITHVSFQETRSQFAIRRIFRIYPPLIVAILFGLFLDWVGGKHLLSFKDYLISFTLLNYWITPQMVTLGVAWTLAVEMLFYGLIFFVMPMLKQKPIIAVCIELAIVAIVLIFCKKFGGNFFLFSASFSKLPYLIAGQLIYLLHSRKISPVTFAIATFATFLLIMAGIKTISTAFYPVDHSYIISFFYAYLLFCISLLLQSHISPWKINLFASNTSYSLYLYHGIIGFFLLQQAAKFFKHQIVIIPIVALCYLVAYLSYRFVELPSIQWGRVCANKFKQWQDSRLKVPAPVPEE